MSSAAALRLQIETSLAKRIPGALTPRPRTLREVASTGVEELDALLEGGFPIGAISELVGLPSSGRTTLALATMAEMTQSGKTVAWIDASDALDPESAAAAGVVLSRQLWVRCGLDPKSASMTPASHTEGSSQGPAFLVEGGRVAAHSGGCGSPHPRSEARGLSQAVDAFLQPDVCSRPAPPRDPAMPRRNRMIGTPGAPNRKLLDRVPQDARPLPRRARDREEQVPTDRQPSRRQSMNAERQELEKAKTLKEAQVLNTAAMAANRSRAGAWTDNANNAHGRSLATPPNAIAAGLPRFREMEARAAGQGHGEQTAPSDWKPTFDERAFQPNRQAEKQQGVHRDSPSQAGEATASASLRGAKHQQGREAAPRLRETAASLAGEPPKAGHRRASPIWQSLDQALRATDLLLAAGGFSTLVLDLGNIAPEYAWRIPLATWFRFRSAAERARTVLLVLTQHPCARSSAELVLRLHPAELQTANTLFTGTWFRIAVDRRRFEVSPSVVPAAASAHAHTLHIVSSRKQPQRERGATWQRAAAWTGTKHAQP